MSRLIDWVYVLDMKVLDNCIHMILIENRYESSLVRETLEEVLEKSWVALLFRSLVTS
jgi:hypothetical protein